MSPDNKAVKELNTSAYRLPMRFYLMLGGAALILSAVFILIFANLRSLNARVDTVLAVMLAKQRQQAGEMSLIGEGIFKDINIEPITGGIDDLAWSDIEDFVPADKQSENDAIMPWVSEAAEFFADPNKKDALLPVYANHNVYLTFDDGPSIYTKDILDILSDYGVKATFFTNGKEGEEMLSLYRRIVDEGHTLAMHSFSHNYADIYSSKERFGADFEKIQYYLYGITGVKSNIYRFPGGSSGVPVASKLPEFIDYLHSRGVEYYDWNISAMDATQDYVSPETIVSNCLRNVTAFEDAIMLLHDRAGKQTTVEALPILLDRLLKMENITILPITEETKPVQHRQ